MRINIKGTNIELTADISDYLNKRLSSLEKLVHDKNETAMLDVEIGRTTKHHQSGDIFKSELNLNIGSKNFRAVTEATDLFSSIDAAKGQMMNELRSNKGKKMHLIRRGGQKVKALMKGLYWWRQK